MEYITYYQFLYPNNGIFRFSYPSPDTLTQFAPFVVQKGNLQRVELIYVDNTPVYVGQVGNIQPYSFAIDSGYHKIEIRTPNHFLTLDSIFFEPKLKHILSIEADTTKAFIEKRPQILSESEFSRILPYLMVVQRNIPSNFSYLKQGERRAYFFERLENGHWRNTYESAQIISTILPDFISTYQEIEPTELRISGAFDKAFKTFPFDTSFYSLSPLNIQKIGTAPIYMSFSHQYHETDPESKSNYFQINSTLDGNSVIESDSGKWVIRAGKPITLKVEVEVKKASEYIMVEIPIPSVCSYHRKKRIFNGIETYR